MSDAMRHHIMQPGQLFQTLARAFAHGLRMPAPLSKSEERTAAANYWRMLGHDMPAADRAERQHKLTIDAPVIGSARRHTPA